MKKILPLILVIICMSALNAQDVKIACIGNSITAYRGSYPNIDENSYPAQLRILMAEGYDIMNFAVSGCTLLKNGDFSIWDEAAFAGALAFEPDIVTILLGTNDSKPQNWIYKDEFILDYIAMIDTFRSLGSNPEIYICLPPPAFSSKFDISDSVIVNEMIPMIEHVASEKNTPLIDFYSHFFDKSFLFYDGIHPTPDGLWEYAKVFYNVLTQNTIQQIEEVNLALTGMVYTSNSNGIPEYLNDNNLQTGWVCENSTSVTINLGDAGSLGMFQILLSEALNFGYTIETSEDSTSWAMVIDGSGNPDTSQAIIENTEPVNARWVRFTLNTKDQPIEIRELRILQSAPVYAPVVVYYLAKVTDTYVKFNLPIYACENGGYLKYVYGVELGSHCDGGSGFQLNDELLVKASVLLDKEKYYIARFYKDGYEASTDTLQFDYSISAIKKRTSSQPNRFVLHQNYPNPFNPSTTIRYHLGTSGKVKMAVYNCLGRELNILVDRYQAAGDHSVQFQSGHLSSGVYFYSIETNNLKMVKKMLLLR